MASKRPISPEEFANAKKPRRADYVAEVINMAQNGAPTDAVYAAELTYCDPDLAAVIKSLYKANEVCSSCGAGPGNAGLFHASYCCRHVLCASCVCSAMSDAKKDGRCPRCPKCPAEAKDVVVDEWKRGYSAYVPERSRGMIDPVCPVEVDASMYVADETKILEDDDLRVDHMLRFRNWVVDTAYEEGSWMNCPSCRARVYNYTGVDRVARCPNPSCAGLFCIECCGDPHPSVPCTDEK